MKDNKEGKQDNKRLALLITCLIILLVAVIGTAIFYVKNKDKREEKTLAYTDLIKEMSSGNIEKIEMTTGSTSVKVKIKNVEEEKTSIVPETESFMGLVQEKVAEGNEIQLIQEPKSVITQIASVIITFLPTALMVPFFKITIISES